MTKPLLFFFVVMLGISQSSFAQPLVANAGGDKVVCQSSTDTIRLGGLPVASGGTPPYTYLWTIKNMSATSAWYYLDSIDAANPITESPLMEDSVIFQLKVTDNVNAVAYDEVRVYFSDWIYTMGQIAVSKFEKDTIVITPGGGGISNYPIVSYNWHSSPYLGDTTKQNVLCWTPTFKEFDGYMTDNKGCKGGFSRIVWVHPTSVPELTLTHQANFYPNPINETTVLKVSADMLGATLQIFAVDGKRLVDKIITTTTTALEDQLGSNRRILMYRIEKTGMAPIVGKLSVN